MARKALAIFTIILGSSISVLYLYEYPSHLTVAIADPPPTGYSNSITGIYVNITEIGVHAAGASNNSGWHTIVSGISMNLMSVISTSKLLGMANLPPGKYSELRFFAGQAVVTISGVNSTYTIPSGAQTGIKVIIPNGGFHIYGGQSLTVQLDLSFNNNEIINNTSKTLNPVATATVM